MSSSIAYIDSYFQNEMSPDERRVFEQRCEQDTEFAREVSFYVMSRAELKSKVREEKRRVFHGFYQEFASRGQRQPLLRKLWPYALAVAASILLFVLFFVNMNSTPGALATRYIEQNFTTLSVTMGESDSLQLGINAFNKKAYDHAEHIFKSLSKRDGMAAESSKYLGITYLMRGNYDDAIIQFDKLAAYPDLYVNPGKFYGALARFKRSAGNDEEEAERLLHEVVDRKLPGSRDAADWIEQLK
jgi:tetratricopeptide (TPR) repeat protein